MDSKSLEDKAEQPPAAGDPLHAVIDNFLEVEDERALPLQEAVRRAIRDDVALHAALGVRGSLRAVYLRSVRDSTLSAGKVECGSTEAFVEAYGHWRVSGKPHTKRAGELFQAMKDLEDVGVSLPSSNRQLRRVTTVTP